MSGDNEKQDGDEALVSTLKMFAASCSVAIGIALCAVVIGYFITGYLQ